MLNWEIHFPILNNSQKCLKLMNEEVGSLFYKIVKVTKLKLAGI